MISRIAMLALVCAGASGLAIAQTQTPPPDTTSPSTTTPAPREAPATGSSTSRPSSASSPHQRQATGKEVSDQMKDCIAKKREYDATMTKSAAHRVCEKQLESSSPSNR